MSTTKKDQLYFVLHTCVTFFALAIVCSFIYCLAVKANYFPIILIGQWLVLDAFLFVGLLFGATDIIVKIKSIALKTFITSFILYIAAMIILSNMVWNPFESFIKFFATTFLFACAAFIVANIYIIWQKHESKKYTKLIEEFKLAQNHVNEDCGL